jgi:hypothetical protein
MVRIHLVFGYSVVELVVTIVAVYTLVMPSSRFGWAMTNVGVVPLLAESTFLSRFMLNGWVFLATTEPQPGFPLVTKLAFFIPEVCSLVVVWTPWSGQDTILESFLDASLAFVRCLVE